MLKNEELKVPLLSLHSQSTLISSPHAAAQTCTQGSRAAADACDKSCDHPNYANHTLCDSLPRRGCY